MEYLIIEYYGHNESPTEENTKKIFMTEDEMWKYVENNRDYSKSSFTVNKIIEVLDYSWGV